MSKPKHSHRRIYSGSVEEVYRLSERDTELHGHENWSQVQLLLLILLIILLSLLQISDYLEAEDDDDDDDDR